jgi:hypothetical protein
MDRLVIRDSRQHNGPARTDGGGKNGAKNGAKKSSVGNAAA